MLPTLYKEKSKIHFKKEKESPFTMIWGKNLRNLGNFIKQGLRTSCVNGLNAS